MLMHLQMDGRGPLHAQLTRALKTVVFAGKAAQGARLPPTRLLARELGLSRNTVLAAYEQLRAEGFVDGRVGSGSYVSAPSPAPRPRVQAEHRIEPQSTYMRRARRAHDHANIPGKNIPGVRFSLQYGVPLANPALTTAWARALSHAALYTPPNYPIAQGSAALRQAICDYLVRRRGIQAEMEDVVIVAGTQQAVALVARVLLDASDRVAIEEPQYYSTRVVLQAHGARLQPVPVDRDGLVCDALPSDPPRLVCVTPSHQFPTGALLPLSRRMELLEYAHDNDCWILEDDYDGEFRYDAKPLAALRSLDRDGRVIYIGTFSKTLFPSLRLGYVVVPRRLRDDFVAAKWLEDFGCPAIEQAALARFMQEGGFERHLRRASQALKIRRAALLEGLRKLSRGRLEIADSHAGMHLTVWLRDRDRAQGDAFIANARERGLGLFPIWPYYLSPPDSAGLLLGYGGLSVGEIEQALAIFEQCLEDAYA
ncbi:MAG TPA: PLP-dependent aminotransferase family protein [Pseudoxanthomonas sp.]